MDSLAIAVKQVEKFLINSKKKYTKRNLVELFSYRKAK